jgi:hypothetical protein
MNVYITLKISQIDLYSICLVAMFVIKFIKKSKKT